LANRRRHSARGGKRYIGTRFRPIVTFGSGDGIVGNTFKYIPSVVSIARRLTLAFGVFDIAVEDQQRGSRKRRE
jgi:hypothetical protein